MLQFAPGALLAAILRGHANERLGNYNAALADYDRIVKITPKSLPFTLAYALDSRAWLRATCPDRSLRNGTQAVAGAQLACKSVNWAKSDYIDTLAAAYAETRDFDGASSYEQKAVERVRHDAWLTTAKDRQDAVAICEHRLAMYQRHEPYRETH